MHAALPFVVTSMGILRPTFVDGMKVFELFASFYPFWFGLVKYNGKST